MALASSSDAILEDEAETDKGGGHGSRPDDVVVVCLFSLSFLSAGFASVVDVL